ncbi:MAG: 4-hydroxy-3-methylbut-2-enyl diphosphate reductase [Zetaproteobacteria bacterium]|nr:MAG: 4-hydroxy-3-methylbut-2-enyl diphosphate reductase [Zetaproteobacteria bacterium]
MTVAPEAGSEAGAAPRRRVLLANPRGFCAGVDRAIEVVEQALARFGAPVFVRHEIVHNRHVVARLRRMGAVFVEELDQVPAGSVVIFSAHGVSRAVEEQAERTGLQVIDATCPLVTKVHREIKRHVAAGRRVVLIGHRGHPEVEGAMGQVDAGAVVLIEGEEDVEALPFAPEEPLAYVTQTTLSVDDTRAIITALARRFPHIAAPKKEDICYATSNRQQAVKRLAACCPVVLVIGSANSSNSNRLREVAERNGARGYLIDDADAIRPEWLAGCDQVGVTAGASAPEVLVDAVVDWLRRHGFSEVAELEAAEERIEFTLPAELRAAG